MFAIGGGNCPTHRHFLLLEHGPNSSPEIHVQQCLRTSPRVGHDPDTLAVGSPIQAANTCPTRDGDDSLSIIREEVQSYGRIAFGSRFACHGKPLSIRRQAPVEIAFIKGINLSLLNLLAESFIGIKSEEALPSRLHHTKNTNG